MSEVSCVAVALQWSGPSGQYVELIGDFPDWHHPITMTEVEPGKYECHLKLEPGLYRYKFRVNQQTWVVDPNALLLDHTEGFSNCVLMVGGLLKPVLFAPDRQHWTQWEDGRIVIHVEISEDSPFPSSLCLTCGDESSPHTPPQPITSVPFLRVMTRGKRQLLRAEIRR